MNGDGLGRDEGMGWDGKGSDGVGRWAGENVEGTKRRDEPIAGVAHWPRQIPAGFRVLTMQHIHLVMWEVVV